MTTIELKNVMIQRINEINDVAFLNALKTIIESKTKTEVISLTTEQRNEIIASMKEIEQGLYIEHELLDKKFSKWAGAR